MAAPPRPVPAVQFRHMGCQSGRHQFAFCVSVRVAIQKNADRRGIEPAIGGNSENHSVFLILLEENDECPRRYLRERSPM